MIRRAAPVVAAYVAVTAVMTWPFVNYAEFANSTYGGDMLLIIWTLAWDNHAVLSGEPLFQSNLFFPAENSLRYNEHLFGVSLFTLPWAAAGASPVLAHNVTWWTAWVLNGLCTYALLRRYVHRPLAAFLGSLVFLCSFSVMLHAHAHLHLIWLWPMPLSMLLLERWFDEPRWGRMALWVMVVVLGVLTSWYVAVMMLLVNALAAVALVAWPRQRLIGTAPLLVLWRRRVVHLLVAAVVAAGLVYPFARHYVGMRGGPGEAAANAASLASYLVPPANTLVGQWWTALIGPQPGPIYGEQTLFAGWLALALAAIGLGCLLRGGGVPKRAWVFALLASAGLAVSFGPSPGWPGGPLVAPFAWLSALPGFEGMRAPARFAVVGMLGLSGLIAIAAERFLDVPSKSRGLAVLAACPLMLAEWYVVDFPAGKPGPRAVPAIYETVEVQSARSLISLPEYWGGTDWVLGGSYLYYSMSHWRPIFNGFGRTGPPGYDDLVRMVQAFPETAEPMRALGLQYVVLHAERFPEHGRAVLAAARVHPSCRLVRRVGDDYLFELVAPGPTGPSQ